MQEVGQSLWRWASARSKAGPSLGGSMATTSGDHQIMALLLTSLPLLMPLGAWGVEAVVDFSIEVPAMDPEIDEENREKLETFSGVWQEIFKWSFFSAVLIHLMAAVTAFFTLRKHKYGRL
ncbi:uncharacterized protein LOC143037865 isoform X2 [Oratosquilla oratoria]|uniref:uncharacterized protein LOC143037865 isoform X2 n=1 Tax=Oratosquilla oratoria TaxID=337810 RepID=UPI003F75B082